MIRKIIILNSESEFRNCVNLSLTRARQITISNDVLDNTIYFYCFTKDGILLAAKEPSKNGFENYCEIYTDLARGLNWHIRTNSKWLITINI